MDLYSETITCMYYNNYFILVPKHTSHHNSFLKNIIFFLTLSIQIPVFVHVFVSYFLLYFLFKNILK
jgi:hypothetical protein